MRSIFIIFYVAALVNCQQRQIPPQQIEQGGQQQVGLRQDDQPPIPGQQQMQGWPNRQQQQVVKGGQQQVGQRQDEQPPMPDQQQLHGGQNRQQQQTVTEENWQLLVKCLDMDCQAQRVLQGQQQLHGGQNRQQQQVGKGGQQQVGQRQDEQPPMPGQQQLQGGQNRQQQQKRPQQVGQQQVGQRQDEQPPMPGQQQLQGGQNRQQQQKRPQQVGQQQVGQRQGDCDTGLCKQTFPLRQQQWIKTRQEVECNELDCPGIEYWSGNQRQDAYMYTYCQEIPVGLDPFCDQVLGFPEPQQYTDDHSDIHVDEIIHADIAEVVLPLVVG